MYLTTSDILIALAPSTVMAIFDDNNDGVLDQASIDGFNARASAMTDSWIAPVYDGPFPITQQPVPALIRELTLGYFTYFMYERHPEYTRTLGENQADRYKRVTGMGQSLQDAVLRIPDLTSGGTPANVGGYATNNSHFITIDNADGSSNTGDF